MRTRIRPAIPILIFGCFIATSLIVYMQTYVPFMPLMFDNDKEEYVTVDITDDFNENLQVVLMFYSMDFEVADDGGILVKRKLMHDKELIHNFTRKALDEEWLKDKEEFVEKHRSVSER